MRNRILWTLWIVGTLALAGAGFAKLYLGGNRTTFMPGQTEGVHHQIELACESCHTADPFASQAKVQKTLNKTCVSCHKQELADANDSHPIKKFKNPRMAAYWDKIDARFCTSCHIEHQSDESLPGMVTLAGDFCMACHSEGDQDVRANRETHADLGYETCASAGCHNFHDNRALYEDFLVKHAGAPWLDADAMHPAEAIARSRPRPETAEIETYLATLTIAEDHRDDEIDAHWAASAHAAADVTCASCHAADAETPEEIETAWTDHPDQGVCADCHRGEAKTFSMGRHGMRQHPELAKPRSAKAMLKRLGWKNPPDAVIATLEAYLDDPDVPLQMSTTEARVTLAPEAHGELVTCNSCHAPHEADISFAAVDGCLTCHADEHSLAYPESAHAVLWQDELDGMLPAGSGVTCATCHMPKSERDGRVTTNHNQNDTLRPNEKMIRPVCLECHSLEFSIDALADEELIARNFRGKPDRHIESIDWALSRVEQPADGANE